MGVVVAAYGVRDFQMSDAMKLNDLVETRPGVQTIGGWSGVGTIEQIIDDPKEPDNPIVVISVGIKLFLFNANELQKI